MKRKLLTLIALLAVMVGSTGLALAANPAFEVNKSGIPPFKQNPIQLKNGETLHLDLVIDTIDPADFNKTLTMDIERVACILPIQGGNCNELTDYSLSPPPTLSFILNGQDPQRIPQVLHIDLSVPSDRPAGTKYPFGVAIHIPQKADIRPELAVLLVGSNITGKKCNDLDGNGICGQGEPGLQGWTIKLTNTDTGEIQTTSTDASGNYIFTKFNGSQYLGLRGNFTVEEVPQAGWTQTGPPAPGTYNNVFVDANDVTDLNFANARINLNISGRKFNDLDNDSVEDPGEPGLSGWQIDLNFTNGTIFRTTTTASDGAYKFENVPQGTYIVQEVLQPNWSQTFPTTGTPKGTYDVTLTNVSITGLDFGNFQPPPVGNPGKVVGWGNIGPKASPEKTFKIFAYTLFMPKGTIEVHDNVKNLDIVATQIDSVLTDMNATPKTGTITGKATVNGKGPYAFTVQVVDAADPGAGADMFTIDVSSPTPYRNSGTLSMGDVNVVK